MPYKYEQKNIKYSRELRKNLTDQERKLWYCFLKDLPLRFHRQKVIGKYIVDFYCAKAGLVIELDGSQHFEEEGIQNDKERDRYLESLGLSVIRYANNDIDFNFEGVCQDILSKLGLL